eukprot:1459686-Pleurochrysis_carterae.AAC.1
MRALVVPAPDASRVNKFVFVRPPWVGPEGKGGSKLCWRKKFMAEEQTDRTVQQPDSCRTRS